MKIGAIGRPLPRRPRTSASPEVVRGWLQSAPYDQSSHQVGCKCCVGRWPLSCSRGLYSGVRQCSRIKIISTFSGVLSVHKRDSSREMRAQFDRYRHAAKISLLFWTTLRPNMIIRRRWDMCVEYVMLPMGCVAYLRPFDLPNGENRNWEHFLMSSKRRRNVKLRF